MKVSRFALIALAAVVFSAFSASPASAASWQLCLRTSPSGGQDYYLNFVVQGNGIVVTGVKNVSLDDHGPVFGTLSKPPLVASNWELGLTVTIANGGDYANANTENIVFIFASNGSISYKKWLRSNDPFTQGLATVFTCPA